MDKVSYTIITLFLVLPLTRSYYCYKCSTCLAGFYPSGDYDCKPCISDCKSCNNSYSCLQCNDRYRLSYGKCIYCGYQCNSCQPRFYYLDGRCLQCSQNCERCESQAICKRCAQLYFLKNGQCKSCGNQCQSCIVSFGCIDCLTGYYLLNQTCYACPSNCFCHNGVGCSGCRQSSQQLINGVCSQKVTTNSTNIGVIVGSISIKDKH